MARTRLFLITSCSCSPCCWLWWVGPRAVDMAAYAPADSLVFLESNNPSEVTAALANTDAWKLVDDLSGDHWRTEGNNWSTKFVRWTGIGPTNSVILTRAQLAVVVTHLEVSQDDDSLTVKPEGALLVETHTAASRIKAPVEQAIKKFAEAAYGHPTLRRTKVDGPEFIEWIAPGGSRQVVATIRAPLSLSGIPSERCRNFGRCVTAAAESESDEDLHGCDAISGRARGFWLCAAANSSGRLLSVAVPMLVGRAPGTMKLHALSAQPQPRLLPVWGGVRYP